MKSISEVNDLDSAYKEISMLYKSTSFSAWSKLVRVYIPPRTEEQLEDPFLDGWRKALENRKQYNHTYSAFNWIFTIMNNNTLNIFTSAYNRLKISPQHSTDNKSQELILSTIPTTLTTVIEKLEAEQIQNLIDDAIQNEMSVRERIAFKRYIYDNKKQAEIAIELDCAIGTVNTLIKSARNIVKYHLEKNNIELH